MMRTSNTLLFWNLFVWNVFDQVNAFSDDYVEPMKYPESTWKWGLPSILQRNDPRDERLANCLNGIHPNDLCHPGSHSRMYTDSKDATQPIQKWAQTMREDHHKGLYYETYKIPKDRFVPYCHHHDDCPNPAWRIMPLMILEQKVHSNLLIAPNAARTLEFMIKNIPGLVTVAISLSEGGGHITPHCGGTEGFQFIRHHLAIRVPQPAARFKICGRVYEFSERAMMSFNNSIPHEVINPAPEPRLVLLFDVLLDDIHRSEKGRAATMDDLNSKWFQTLDKIKEIDTTLLANATRRLF